jgi:hypothetical protein
VVVVAHVVEVEPAVIKQTRHLPLRLKHIPLQLEAVEVQIRLDLLLHSALLRVMVADWVVQTTKTVAQVVLAEARAVLVIDLVEQETKVITEVDQTFQRRVEVVEVREEPESQVQETLLETVARVHQIQSLARQYVMPAVVVVETVQ